MQEGAPAEGANDYLSSYADFQEELSSLFDTDESLIRAIEERIATCMKEGGFDYVPFPDQYLHAPVQTETSSSDSLERSLLRLPDIGQPIDPNEAIVGELDDATRAAYNDRLWGTSDEIGMTVPDGGFDSLDLSVEAIGCQNFEGIALTGGRAGYEYETKALDFWTRVQDRVSADRRVVLAEKELERCKRESGFFVAEEGFSDLFDSVAVMEPEDSPDAFADAMVKLRESERKLVETESSCKESVSLDSVIADVEREVFTELAAEG